MGTTSLLFSLPALEKTGYFLIYILMLLALAENPRLCHPHGARVAPDPCIMVVYPTNGLEEEQASVFENSWVSTVVINAGTLKKARESTPPVDLWTVARRNVAVILLSPEMLTKSVTSWTSCSIAKQAINDLDGFVCGVSAEKVPDY
ncbi:hypothetical protein C8Q80DRAFT_1357528 [Daedaleopsis nitida]|nr:hypothetical protein C8Q80DRAFT_1357528 [Daedaleopsis nitida]